MHVIKLVRQSFCHHTWSDDQKDPLSVHTQIDTDVLFNDLYKQKTTGHKKPHVHTQTRLEVIPKR